MESSSVSHVPCLYAPREVPGNLRREPCLAHATRSCEREEIEELEDSPGSLANFQISGQGRRTESCDRSGKRHVRGGLCS